MLRARAFFVYWLPVLLWMALIFGASGDRASFRHSSRILEPFLHWLFPNLGPKGFLIAVLIFRKCAHVTEYAVLALLLWRARFKPAWRGLLNWDWRFAAEALWAATLYAATDEFHQTFGPAREGCLRDVVIDASGAAAGLAALYFAGRWMRLW